MICLMSSKDGPLKTPVAKDCRGFVISIFRRSIWDDLYKATQKGRIFSKDAEVGNI